MTHPSFESTPEASNWVPWPCASAGWPPAWSSFTLSAALMGLHLPPHTARLMGIHSKMSRGSCSTGGDYRGVSQRFWAWLCVRACFSLNHWNPRWCEWMAEWDGGEHPACQVEKTQAESLNIYRVSSLGPGPSRRHYSERGIRHKMRQHKVFKRFSLSSRGGVVLTTNMTPPGGVLTCTQGRAYRQGAPPPDKEGVRFTVCPLSSRRWWTVKHLSFTLRFVCGRQLKAEKKRPGRDGPASCSFFSHNGGRCRFSFRIN